MRNFFFITMILILSAVAPALAEVRITEQADGIVVIEIDGPPVQERAAVSAPVTAAPMPATGPAIPAAYEGEPFARIDFLTKELQRIEQERAALRLDTGAKTPQEKERDRIALIRKSQEFSRYSIELARLKAKFQGPPGR